MPRWFGACLGSLVAVGACGGPDPADAPALSLACEAVIPPSDSGSGRVGRVAPGRNGRLAWSDGRRGQFLLRDSSGRTRLIGREGSGPGEFRSVFRMGWVGDTLWAADFPEPRVQFFSDTGLLLHAVTAMSLAAWQGRPDGRLVGIAAVPASRLAVPLPWVVLAHRSGTTTSDTVAVFPQVSSEPIMLPIGGQEFATLHPLLPQTVVASDPAGSRFCAVIPTAADAVRVWCVDDHGGSILDRELPLARRPVTDSLYEAVVAAFTTPDPGRTAVDMRRRIPRPSHLPVVISMMVADGGVIWLKRSEHREPAQEWLRLNPEGTVRDRIVLPRAHRLMSLQGDTAWVAIPDSDELETLARCVVGREK